MKRVEWIGVMLPSQDDRVTFMKISGQLNETEQATLNAVAAILSDRVRSVNSRRRRLSVDRVPGLSKTYTWGPTMSSYTQNVNDADVKVIFDQEQEYEFRLVDDPAHANRKPIVPPEIMVDAVLKHIMSEAKRQGPVVFGSPVFYKNPEEVLKRYEALTAT